MRCSAGPIGVAQIRNHSPGLFNGHVFPDRVSAPQAMTASAAVATSNGVTRIPLAELIAADSVAGSATAVALGVPAVTNSARPSEDGRAELSVWAARVSSCGCPEPSRRT
ncbi:hypothetical protein EBN03_29030 [Nocardia stercoris]|uniref:Uncharacterized protein n=1 Tax=Nocardia stercoris TaxID=2483361 RepID=A0A3M2KSQ0_9NOCA|nr:hypothetical protein EBN03_29030 [Nocardia stercoris]